MPNQRQETIVDLLCFMAFAVLFAVGFTVGTKTHRDTLADSDIHFAEKIGPLMVVLFCYTYSNILLICCLTSIMGGIFRRIGAPDAVDYRSLWVLLFSSSMPGLVAYLALVSGVMTFVQTWTFSSDQYARVACIAALCGMTVGYNPGLASKILNKFGKSIDSDDKSKK